MPSEPIRYKRQQPKWITDELILEWVKTGALILRIDPVTGECEVWKYHTSRKRYLLLQPWQDKRNGRWRYVLRWKERSRTIHRNKLFWMFEHRRLVGEGLHIDHIDHDNQNDHPSNLRERNGTHNSADNTPTGYAEEQRNRDEAAAHGSRGDF